MLRRPQPFCPSLSISQTIWQPSVCAMFALRAQDFSSFAVVVTSILEPGSQFGAVGGPDHGYASSFTGTHHRYPLSFLAYQKFHSPKRRCRPYYHTPFVENIRSFLMIWRLATLPDTAGLALWPKTWAAFRISHLRVGEPPTRPQTCDSGNSPDYCE